MDTKNVGLLRWDYTVAATIQVVNAGALGVVEGRATVSWRSNSLTKSDRFLLEECEEKVWTVDLQEVGADGQWKWKADVRVVE